MPISKLRVPTCSCIRCHSLRSKLRSSSRLRSKLRSGGSNSSRMDLVARTVSCSSDTVSGCLTEGGLALEEFIRERAAELLLHIAAIDVFCRVGGREC